jgi:uncharacterized protein
MTAQEQQMLQGLAERINGTQLPEKDADAEQYLQQTLGRNPDAMYILAQTVLVQQYALTQAQKQLADAKVEADQLRQQAQQPKHSTSFLGSLLGRSDEPERPAPPPPPPPPPPAYAQPQYTPVPPPPPPAYAPAYPAYGAPVYGAPGGFATQTGGFLRGAAQTAAGVAAGALAFEGVESLMHGFGHAAGYGSDMGFDGFGGGGRPEEIVNNYYVDDAGRDDRSSGSDNASYDDRNDDMANDASFDDGSNSSDDSDSGGDTFDV